MAQSEPAAAPEEARRRRCLLRRADQRGKAVAPRPEGFGSSSTGSGGTSPPRRRRAEAAAGERVRDARDRWGRGSGLGARPRLAENGLGRRAHALSPLLARADAFARLLPLPLPLVLVVRGLLLPSPLATARAAACARARARSRRGRGRAPFGFCSFGHFPRWWGLRG